MLSPDKPPGFSRRAIAGRGNLRATHRHATLSSRTFGAVSTCGMEYVALCNFFFFFFLFSFFVGV